MKLAILLTGNVRTWDQTKANFMNTFERYNPDVYVSTYLTRYGYHPHIRGVIGDSSDDIITHDQFLSFFDGVAKSVSINSEVSQEAKLGIHNNFVALDNLLGQVFRLSDALKLMLDSGVKYDAVIKTRCDLLYDKIDLDVDLNDKVLIDSGNVFPNDCIYATTPANMIKIASFMNSEIYAPVCQDSHEKAPHQLLYNAVTNAGLNFEQRKMITGVMRKGNIIQVY